MVYNIVMGELPVNISERDLAEFCRRYRIQRLALFGSALRDQAGPESDLDLLVEFEPGTRVGLKFFTIERRLSELLGSKVDLNTAGFISPSFRDDVLAEARVIYEAA